MTQTQPLTKPESQASKPPLKRQLVSFVVYEVDNTFRRLSEDEKARSKTQFQNIVQKFQSLKNCQIITYNTMGLRANGDFLLWIIAYDVDTIQAFNIAVAKSHLGRYLSKPHSFLSMTKRSTYIDPLDPEHQEDRVHIIPGKYKYFFVYPFIKKRDWYLLSMEERQEMMTEHIVIGNKYPSVKLNTTYSFGLDDQEFVVAFESDSCEDFLDLVQELRESKASSYTLKDTPIITCIRKDIMTILDEIG